MSNNRPLAPETRLASAGCHGDNDHGAVVRPPVLSSTFERHPDGSYPSGFSYSREDNPTRRDLEVALADLEGGHDCAAFASGMAATMAVFQALPSGSRILLPDDVYYGVRELLREVFAGTLHPSEVDMTDEAAFKSAIETYEPDLIWAESPSNPLLKITDLAKVANYAQEAGALLAVDGTWTTPLLQESLALGADLVVHSLTKYYGGHSDVLGGAVICKEEGELFEKVRHVQKKGGSMLDAFSAWLVLRGMRTLSVRLERQCANATKLAHMLLEDERVKAVYHPSLRTHPGHEVAKRQMKDFGAMLSFELESEEAAVKTAATVEVFTRATSLGGTESLIEHRASIEPEGSPTPSTLLRCSIGIEAVDDLLTDLSNALP